MRRELPLVSPLELRKKLLIAESELNRARLMDEWEAATDWHYALSAGVKTVGSIASAASLLVSGLRAFRCKRDPQNGADASWLQPVVKGAGLISSLWVAFRSRGCEQKDK